MNCCPLSVNCDFRMHPALTQMFRAFPAFSHDSGEAPTATATLGELHSVFLSPGDENDQHRKAAGRRSERGWNSRRDLHHLKALSQAARSIN